MLVWSFTESLLYSALMGDLTEDMAREWLVADDLALALRLIQDPLLRSAFIAAIDAGVTPALYRIAWDAHNGHENE